MSNAKLMELVRKKKQALQQQSGRREKTVKPQPGKNRFRVLPGWRNDPEDPTFFHDFGQHFIKDTGNKLQAVYMCSEKTFGSPCAICEAVAEGIAEASDDDVIKAMTEAKSKGRVLMNALHLDGEDPKTPVILDLTPTTFEKVLEIMDEYGDITALEGGVDIVITRSGKGLNTEYSIMPSPKSADVDPSVLKNLHNLDEYVKQEYDEGRLKALNAIGAVSGVKMLTASAADKPFTPAPDDDVLEGEIAEEAPATEDDNAVGATKAETVASDGLGDDLSEDDLDAMLADLES